MWYRRRSYRFVAYNFGIREARHEQRSQTYGRVRLNRGNAIDRKCVKQTCLLIRDRTRNNRVRGNRPSFESRPVDGAINPNNSHQKTCLDLSREPF